MDRKGFTLLEVLISIMILVTVLSTVFASYSGTFRIVSETEAQAEIYYMARIALERMLEDLESVYVPEKGKGSSWEGQQETLSLKFEGEDKDVDGQSADSMHFPSRSHIIFEEDDQPWAIVQISYYAEKDEESGSLILFRSEKDLLEETQEDVMDGLPLCENLASIEFRYVGPEGEEQDGWDPEERMPRMVSISLGFVNPSNPESSIQFATSIALPVVTAGGTEEEWASPW